MFQLDYIECECDRLGDFAASEEVVDLGYGWTLPAPLSCALVMVRSVCLSVCMCVRLSVLCVCV